MWISKTKAAMGLRMLRLSHHSLSRIKERSHVSASPQDSEKGLVGLLGYTQGVDTHLFTRLTVLRYTGGLVHPFVTAATFGVSRLVLF